MHAVVGVLGDDTDPMVTVMKLEKAPQETYADIGGLDTQIQEIKVRILAPIFIKFKCAHCLANNDMAFAKIYIVLIFMCNLLCTPG